MTSRTYLIVEYRRADGKTHLNETHTGETIAKLVSQAPSMGWDIMSVTRMTVGPLGMTAVDASAEVCRAVIAHYVDDESGIPDDWTELFRRVGESVVDINTEAEIARAQDSAEWSHYLNDMGADYRASVR